MPRTSHAARTAGPTIFRINGRRTSLALEDALIENLRDIALREGTTPSAILSAVETEIAATGSSANLTSAIRVHIANYYRHAAESAAAELAALKHALATARLAGDPRPRVRSGKAALNRPPLPTTPAARFVGA
ncbi:ribbon-helix-helix domain-containing protein [Azospirillum canadense]|uniref:ribbon-helix-helix domain-containing protein n=1 Tax=Azospirillum canadense TaxID=403962 RepID=UPI0022277B7F|nr:ribbon-helix-helix domain-containing protein [Azospirillum canadense]MCW2240758.1 putative DNA-binding ribbon-helix-helix protein [Azospirillum canadense]